MDMQAARDALFRLTRQVFGATAIIRARLEGAMIRVPDPDRADMVDLSVRFDIDPDVEPTAGHGRQNAPLTVAVHRATVSVPRADLAWLPERGHQVEVTSRGVTTFYSISRVAEDMPGLVLLYLSRERP